jgi:hypothetical protein
MKFCELNDVDLGNLTIDQAVGITYADDVLKEVHGESLRIHRWHKSQRKLEMQMELHGVPNELKKILGGDKMRATVRQKVTHTSDTLHEVHNGVRLHILGAELVKIRPRFQLRRMDDRTFFSAKVVVHAVFPPPLNHIAEHFMVQNASRDIHHYAAAIQKRTQMGMKLR